MELTKKQKDDIETCLYFCPSCKITPNEHANKEEGIKMFFEWSEQGLHKEKIPLKYCNSYFDHLCGGKVWRGRTIHEIYEPTLLDMESGCGYESFIDKTTPRSVVDFLKKELFKGTKADLIEKLYQSYE